MESRFKKIAMPITSHLFPACDIFPRLYYFVRVTPHFERLEQANKLNVLIVRCQWKERTGKLTGKLELEVSPSPPVGKNPKWRTRG